MLGYHQLQNAVTATCAALCLRWQISDGSILSGLENTQLLGRNQFLKKEELDALGLSGSMALLDGVCQDSMLVLVVAMASDKDHVGFAWEFLTGLSFEAIFLTEVNIAGDKSRTTSALFLRDIWAEACSNLGVKFTPENSTYDLKLLDASVPCTGNSTTTILGASSSVIRCLKASHKVLQERKGKQPGTIVVTG
ncbi:hypothetical protein KSS87_020868, partial [Heliosperma pusillum]